MAGWKNPRRGVYRRVRLHFAQSSSGHRSKCRMRFLLGPCGALCAQIWPLGGQNRARGTFASLRTDGEISEVPRNTPFFHQLLGRNKHFPAFPSMIRACYGRCESLTTFQCQVVENEAWPQTDRSLELPPVPCLTAKTYRKKVQEKCREKVKLLHFSCTFVSASWSKKSAGKVRQESEVPQAHHHPRQIRQLHNQANE